jgi:hypothetical protein
LEELPSQSKAEFKENSFHLFPVPQIKAAAIALSDYREVLYLDSDNIPLSDPALLFDEALYRNGGRAVFWPDFNKDHRASKLMGAIKQEAELELSPKCCLESIGDPMRLWPMGIGVR